jgi:hypothetical protein
METAVEHHHQAHTPLDIGKTILSLGAILAVLMGFYAMQGSVKNELRPEILEIRSDLKRVEEKVNIMVGQQELILRSTGVKR